jgi:phosphoadenylyl-sulfate reductase (thioredoxin)
VYDFDELDHVPAEELLAWGIRTFGSRFCISTSFQNSGMVIIDMAARISSNVRIITLDTGRLPEETYAMMDTVRSRYGLAVETVLPNPLEVQTMVRLHGANLFLSDQALRMLCCHVRKVRPLNRKLRQLSAYAVGLRRLTSEDRNEIRKVEDKNGVIKISPVADWTRQEIQRYLLQHDVPCHPLYRQGFRSIGCAPCTRAVSDGEPERAGRWWWEDEKQKECGLHFAADGTIGRTLDILIGEVSQTTNGYGFDGSGI